MSAPSKLQSPSISQTVSSLAGQFDALSGEIKIWLNVAKQLKTTNVEAIQNQFQTFRTKLEELKNSKLELEPPVNDRIKLIASKFKRDSEAHSLDETTKKTLNLLGGTVLQDALEKEEQLKEKQKKRDLELNLLQLTWERILKRYTQCEEKLQLSNPVIENYCHPTEKIDSNKSDDDGWEMINEDITELIIDGNGELVASSKA